MTAAVAVAAGIIKNGRWTLNNAAVVGRGTDQQRARSGPARAHDARRDDPVRVGSPLKRRRAPLHLVHTCFPRQIWGSMIEQKSRIRLNP